MKRKALFVAALVGLGSVANAQTTQVTNDKGFVVTPEAGDWAIGFNANPLFSFVGNAFNGNTNNSFNSAFMSTNNAIYGKYFQDENTAFRGSLRIASYNDKVVNLYDSNTVNAAPEYLENIEKSKGAGFVLSVGIEKRKGHNRLQGYYGGEVALGLNGNLPFGAAPSKSYEYALEMDTTNMNAGHVGTSRTLSSKMGSTFSVGVRGFIGAEYFVAPKVSIAAEYGWGLSWSTTGAGETVTEMYGYETGTATTETTFEVTTMTGKSSSFDIDTDNLGGAIRLMFHF